MNESADSLDTEHTAMTHSDTVLRLFGRCSEIVPILLLVELLWSKFFTSKCQFYIVIIKNVGLNSKKTVSKQLFLLYVPTYKMKTSLAIN